MIPFPNKKYQIIYADPPWNGLGWNNGGLKCPANHYQVQDVSWIKSLPVQILSDTTCVLFLWVTFPNLLDGIDVIKSWGFKYATCAFNWIKRNKKSNEFFVGCGSYTRANSEICLLGTKGKCQLLRKSKNVRQICDARIQRHSKKPNEIRKRIVNLMGDLPRIELFARIQYPGWDAWGNEVVTLEEYNKQQKEAEEKRILENFDLAQNINSINLENLIV